MEWTSGLLGGQTHGLPLPVGDGEPCQVHHRQPQGLHRGNYLNRLPTDGAEGGAQSFVAEEDLVETLLQRLLVEPPREMQRNMHVISRAAGLDLVEEPQSLLGK